MNNINKIYPRIYGKFNFVVVVSNHIKIELNHIKTKEFIKEIINCILNIIRYDRFIHQTLSNEGPEKILF